MRAVIQRVKQGQVIVEGKTVAEIGHGLVILLGIGPEDTPEIAEQLADKVAYLRIFNDQEDKMNLSLNSPFLPIPVADAAPHFSAQPNLNSLNPWLIAFRHSFQRAACQPKPVFLAHIWMFR